MSPARSDGALNDAQIFSRPATGGPGLARCSPVPGTGDALRCSTSRETAAKQAPAAHRRIIASATQVPLSESKVLCSTFEKAPPPGAPLRNRTVDLLLTINHRQVALPHVDGVTCENTSTDQRLRASDGPPRAPFATQSATHFDLGKRPHPQSEDRTTSRIERSFAARMRCPVAQAACIAVLGAGV
jgi:hypothetical protein